MYRLLTAAILALLVGIIAAPVGAQETQDWDNVTGPQFDSPETDAANELIGIADAEYQQAAEEEEAAGCTLCIEAREHEEEQNAAEDDIYEGVEDLVPARVEAIEAASVEGSPSEKEAQLDTKLAALDNVESYAEEWDADDSSAAEVRAEVEAEKEAVQQQQEAAQAPPETTTETTAAPETTAAAPPAEGQDENAGGDNDQSAGGNDGGGQANPSDASDSQSIMDTLRTGGIGAALALVAAGAIAIYARTRRPKPTAGHTAPRDGEDYEPSPDEPTVGGRDD